jgi:hypothetical protein
MVAFLKERSEDCQGHKAERRFKKMFNFRKIASVLASTVMLGSTVALAAAAYPAPFVQSGAADVAVVWGSNAALSDLVAVTDITNSLQVQLAKQTATSGTTTVASASGGDSVNLATSARKLYYGDAIDSSRVSVSSSDMSSVLADGKVIDLKGTEYSYTQTLKLGNTVSVFGTSGGDLNDPVLYIDAGTTSSDPLYNYTLSLTKNLNVTDDTNVQGQKIKILGVDYVIGASSTNTTLYLYGAGQTVTLVGAESKTVSIAGKDHIVELVAATATNTAKITVDGISKTVTKGSSYSFTGDVTVYVKDITYQSYAGGVQNAELIVGANTLQLPNGATVKTGADATSVQGTNVVVTPAGTGLISGFTVQVAMQKSQTDHIAEGGSFTDPVFGGLKAQFAGTVPALNSSARAKIRVDTDNNQFAYITFTSARAGSKGEQKLGFVYDNNTASDAVQPLLAHQTVTTGGRGLIHVLEGENAQINDWIIVNQGDAGTILNVDEISIDTATSGTVTFSDAITAESQKITVTSSGGTYSKTGVSFYGGTGYNVYVNNNTSPNTVNVTWSSASTTRTLFPRIKLASGGWIALLTQTAVVNGTSVIFPDGLTTLATTGATVSNTTIHGGLFNNGIIWTNASQSAQANTANQVVIAGIAAGGAACNFNSTVGPSVLYLEPKKWNDASFGSYICVPLTTTGTTEIAIGAPVLNGSDSGFLTYNSDNYKSAAVDEYGAFVIRESRTNENGVDTILTPSSQMYLDVLFTSQAATVAAGSVSSGTVKELGSVSVKDSEAAAVSGKNLIVVGGSCVNSVAASLLGSSSALCGAGFSEKTGVSAGQFLIQTFARDGGKIATLVAGYGADDTANAGKYLTTQTVDTSVAAKYIGTSATVATLQTVSA